MVVRLNEIVMNPVESSSIKSIGYSNGILKVEFKNGGSYIYTGVEEYHILNMLTNVKSVGKYFTTNIKNNQDKYICIQL